MSQYSDTLQLVGETLAALGNAVQELAKSSEEMVRGESPITVDDAAERLGVTERTVRKWISDGTLPAVMIAGRWRVSAWAVAQILANGDQRHLTAIQGGRG